MKTTILVSTSTNSVLTAPTGAKVLTTPEQARAWRLEQSRLKADRRWCQSANPLAAALQRAGVTTTH
ncbi:MAG: hypothetical protein KBD16_00425 [Candidatus Pacebacteria bacterium]|nr:hypothetical protein [Candidatus Paceibacterota bacterium]